MGRGPLAQANRSLFYHLQQRPKMGAFIGFDRFFVSLRGPSIGNAPKLAPRRFMETEGHTI